jgi:phage tail protein X
MMTRAFKVFLLMLLFFVAIWAWKFRSRDIRSWLELGNPPPAPTDELAAIRSKVDGVIEPSRLTRMLARIYIKDPLTASPAEVEEFVDPPSEEEDPPPVYYEPEEDQPVEIILREGPEASVARATPPRPAEKGSKGREAEKERPKAGAEKIQEPGKAVAEKSPAPAPKTERAKGAKSEAKPERSRQERTRARPDPHAIPADGVKPPREPEPVLVKGGAPDAPRKRTTVTHVVRKKDTLASLARRYYRNDTEMWRTIYAANQERIANPDELPVGAVIDIPGPLESGSSSSGGKGSRKAAKGTGRTARS